MPQNIFTLATQHAQFEKVKFLVEKGAVTEDKRIQEEFYQAYLLALKSNNLTMVKFLVDNGFEINWNQIYRHSLLSEAVRTQNLDIAKFLVDHGADVNQTNQSESSPLIMATSSRNLEMIDYLIEHGADVNLVVDGDGCGQYKTTALMLASEINNLDIVKFLIAKKADVNFRNEKGRSILSMATDPEIINVLVEHGARK